MIKQDKIDRKKSKIKKKRKRQNHKRNRNRNRLIVDLKIKKERKKDIIKTYALVMARYLSCPAVSQICAFTVFEST